MRTTTKILARMADVSLKRKSSPLTSLKTKRAKFSTSDDEDLPPVQQSQSSTSTTSTSSRSNGATQVQAVSHVSPNFQEKRVEKVWEILGKVEFVPAKDKFQVKRASFQPINFVTKPIKVTQPSQPVASTSKETIPDSPSFSFLDKLRFDEPLSIRWPSTPQQDAPGLNNMGNTCFVNSVLQPLLHTPPLVDAVLLKNMHDWRTCRAEKKSYCVACAMFNLMDVTWKSGNRDHSPRFFSIRYLQQIASHFKPYRQEDAHEFLRFTLDGIQNAVLSTIPKEVQQKLRHQTFLYRIFGGKLRSRVTCKTCGHNSDTFDDMMDLSLDIRQCHSLVQALKSFTKPDILDGQNKYKCEKCKRPVTAEKRFSIEKSPLVFTIQLKRFTNMGKKINSPVEYSERLDISPYLSEHEGPDLYKLYAMTLHHGGSPHSGHYVSYVNTHKGWVEFDDSSRQHQRGFPGQHKHSVYILYYIREPRDLVSAFDRKPNSNHFQTSISSKSQSSPSNSPSIMMNLKRKLDDPSNSPSPAKKLQPITKNHSILPPPTAKLQKEELERIRDSQPTQLFPSIKTNGALMNAAIRGKGGVALVDYEEEVEDVGEKVDRTPTAVTFANNGNSNTNRPKKIDALKSRRLR